MLKCVEFFVKVEENAAEVAAALTPNLPVGKCTIQVFNNETNQAVFLLQNPNQLRTTALPIETYFRNPGNANNVYRWLLLQNEMIENNIKVVRIVVCPTN